MKKAKWYLFDRDMQSMVKVTDEEAARLAVKITYSEEDGAEAIKRGACGSYVQGLSLIRSDFATFQYEKNEFLRSMKRKSKVTGRTTAK